MSDSTETVDSIDLKGYAVDPDSKWLYPPRNMPPSGVKLHILTKSGIAIHGTWRWDADYLGFQYLPKRDRKLELEAIDFFENGSMK